MNIYTVRDNLIQTIEGKERMLADYQEVRKLASRGEDMALYATVSFLKVNIDELKRILKDVEQCIDTHEDKIKNLSNRVEMLEAELLLAKWE